MPEIQRRKTPTVKIGQVRVGWEVPVVVQSMTNTDTADVAATIDAGGSAGPGRLRDRARDGEQRRSRGRGSGDCRGARQARHPRAHRGRLPLQRPPAAEEISRHGEGAGQVPHQSGQCLDRAQGRRQLPHHGGVRGREPEAGAHRRELGLAGPVAADAHDGRKQASPNPCRRAK